MFSRRQFITRSIPAALYLSQAQLLSGCARTIPFSSSPSYRILDWTGDSFGPMHKIRDGWAPTPPPPSRHVDVVIVGSGITGLTAALKLKDRELLILERESETGGNAKSGEYSGIPYSTGAAYLVDITEPYGEIYGEIGVEPKIIPETVDSVWADNKFQPFEKSNVAASFEQLKSFFSRFVQSDDFPCIPIDEATPAALEFDKISFQDFLKSEYPPELERHIDTYCYSAMGSALAETSAYAGLNFYSEIATPVYACPGGNSLIAKKLTDRIKANQKNAIECGAAVFSVENRGKEAWVSYYPADAFAETNPQLTTVAAKHVILCIPPFFVPRIVKGLAPKITNTLHSIKYCSYLVANLCFDERVFSGGYDHWVSDNSPFTDFIDAEFISHGAGTVGEKRPFVLSVYAPYRDALVGRYELFVGNKELLAQRIIAGVQAVAPFELTSLREICLTRYGHQVLKCPPGQITKLLTLPRHTGRILLAHSDFQGMPAIECAIVEGLRAAKAVKS